MKTMTCKTMGGPCDAEIMGSTPDEMMANGMKHLEAAHPEMVENAKNMTKEQSEVWNAEFKKNWDAAPETM